VRLRYYTLPNPKALRVITIFGVDYYRFGRNLYSVSVPEHQAEFIRLGATEVEDPDLWNSEWNPGGGGGYTWNGSADNTGVAPSIEIPYTQTLVDGNEVVIHMEGLEMPRSMSVDVTSGDTVRIRWKEKSNSAWETLGSYTADTEDMLDLTVYALGFTRTVGSSTTSSFTIS
jgi:hypothetical protein